MPNASQRQKMVDDLDRMLDLFEVQPLKEPPPETEPSSAEPDGEISAWIWLVAFVMCPVSALIGGAIVIEQTQELVVGVTAGIAGLIAGFVVAVLVCRIDAWKPPAPATPSGTSSSRIWRWARA